MNGPRVGVVLDVWVVTQCVKAYLNARTAVVFATCDLVGGKGICIYAFI